MSRIWLPFEAMLKLKRFAKEIIKVNCFVDTLITVRCLLCCLGLVRSGLIF